MNFRAEPENLSLTQAKPKNPVVGKPSENARTEGPKNHWSLKELLDALADELGPN